VDVWSHFVVISSKGRNPVATRFTAQRCRSASEKNIFEDLFSSVLSQFKKYHPSGNLKLYNLGILKSLKLRILVKKIPPISLELNFTPNTLGCKGLTAND